MANLAAIDIGTLTARMLICRPVEGDPLFHPLARERAYIRLAEGFDENGQQSISPEAVDRTVRTLANFTASARAHQVGTIRAAATGVMRQATNRADLIEAVLEQTGIKIRVVSGEEEARLTDGGVSHALKLSGRPYRLFDLGGGSTEFLMGGRAGGKPQSIPLGALILTERFFKTDPPQVSAVAALRRHMDNLLQEGLSRGLDPCPGEILVGTGGTVTTLAAIIRGLKRSEITPERMNGLRLIRQEIEALFIEMEGMGIEGRSKMPLMDRDRARVILAGTLGVMRILHFFKANQLTVSLSDILEGIIVDFLEGVNHEQ